MWCAQVKIYPGEVMQITCPGSLPAFSLSSRELVIVPKYSCHSSSARETCYLLYLLYSGFGKSGFCEIPKHMSDA